MYAFNTDSMSGLAMVNQLLGQGASVARGASAFDTGGVHFATGAALVDGTSVSQATLNADSTQWGTPVYGLGSYPVSHFALTLPKIGVYTGGTTAPTNPAFHGTGDGQCTSTAYCEAMFDLTQKEGIPTAQIGQITSTDLAAGVLVEPGLHDVHRPGLDDRRRGRGHAPSRRSSTPAARTSARTRAGRRARATPASRPLNTNTVSGINTPGSTFDATWNTSDPAAWGFDAGGWIYREASSNPVFDPATLAGNGGTIPAATAVATYAPAGDCGGPAGFGNCYGYEINANANLPGRPAVVDQPFGAGHAIMLGFDAWYRAWTAQDERLVLNGVLYPKGSAIPPTTPLRELALVQDHAQSRSVAVAAASLPRVANRPVNPSGAAPAHRRLDG